MGFSINSMIKHYIFIIKVILFYQTLLFLKNLDLFKRVYSLITQINMQLL